MPAPIRSLTTSLTIGVDALAGGAFGQYDLATLLGATATEYAAIAPGSVILSVQIAPTTGVELMQVQMSAVANATTAVSTQLANTTEANTGVPVVGATPQYFYADPTKRYLNVYSPAGCNFYISRVR